LVWWEKQPAGERGGGTAPDSNSQNMGTASTKSVWNMRLYIGVVRHRAAVLVATQIEQPGRGDADHKASKKKKRGVSRSARLKPAQRATYQASRTSPGVDKKKNTLKGLKKRSRKKKMVGGAKGKVKKPFQVAG